jgi:hypothetical protein
MKIRLLFILCFVCFYSQAQIPTKYIGAWKILPANDFNTTKNNQISTMLSDTISWRYYYADYKKDTAAYIKKLKVDYDGRLLETLVINANNVDYYYYNPVNKQYSKNSATATFITENNELVFNEHCGGMYFNSVKIIDISDTKIRFEVIEKVKADYKFMDWALGCLPFSGVLEKSKDPLPPLK